MGRQTRNGRLRFWGLAMAILHSFGAFAQAEVPHHRLKLLSGEVVVQKNADRWSDSIAASGKPSLPFNTILHFTAPLSDAIKTKLAEAGVILADYLPDNSYLTLIHPDSRLLSSAALRDSMGLYGVVDAALQSKCTPRLWAVEGNGQASATLLVAVFPTITPVDVSNLTASLGGNLPYSGLEATGYYKVQIPATKIRSLCNWYGIRSATLAGPMQPCDLQSRPAVRGNLSAAPLPFGGYGLYGDGVTVGVGDNSSGIYHADLRDRVTNFNPAPNSHHGEHVNGIVGSAAIVDPLAGSMAPHVQLVDFLFDLIFPELGPMFNDYGMNITNNSYAVTLGDCSYAGTYDTYAQLIDNLAIKYPYVLNVFASGNDGQMNCSPYVPGFATVAGGYQPAKNNLVVGSYTDYLIEANDESRGPVKDGRIKPEIVATGLGAYSTIGIDQYEWAAGTSMASPQAAGGLAILTERYKQLNSNTLPTSDLLKAVALDGALDLGLPGPDYSYGFGGMDVVRSLRILDSSRYFKSAVHTGDSQALNIQVPPGTAQLKVLICWNDPAASVSAAGALVNDIDLAVFDPTGNRHLPLVPDSARANVNNPATEQPDHLNNVEQVVINHPVAGSYTLNIKGYNIPVASPQAYALAYDVIPNGILMTYPVGGEQLGNADSIRIFWDGIDDTSTFTVSFSSDSGATWTVVSNTAVPVVKHCDFLPAGIYSGNCLVRIKENISGETATSGRFSISGQPTPKLDSSVCPGYIGLHWSPVTIASKYLLLAKTGFYLQVVDSTTDTAYVFKNRSLTEKSYVAVQPVINGNPAYRSVANIVVANYGNCTGSASNGDLMAQSVSSPLSGRLYTSSQLTGDEILTINIRNLGNSPCPQYHISYSVNGSNWTTTSYPDTVYPNSIKTVSIPGFNLADTGTYSFTVAVQNISGTDPNPVNDTIRFTVVQLPNDTVNINAGYTDSFETLPILAMSHDTMGLSLGSRWDFFTNDDSGRMRTYVSDDVTFSGHRGISMDESQVVVAGSQNKFTGTFNLGNYDTLTAEVRIDFDYMMHGMPKSDSGNNVMARGNDAAGWLPLYNYNFNSYPGTITHVQSLSLTDVMRAAKTDFSKAVQIAFCQNDTSLIGAPNYGNGMTIDNFHLYRVFNDAQMLGVVSPAPVNCGLGTTTPLTVAVRNGVNQTLYHVQLSYQLDGGTVNSGILDSIGAKDTVQYTFPQLLNIGILPTHTLNVWLSEAGDSYRSNDSVISYNIRNSAIVSTYPYLENFESGAGGYFSGGYRNSWQYGTPNTPRVHNAASGTKAWKTNLTGNYNNLEKSYLYSPCFDLSALGNPMLSFSLASSVENCGTSLCDEGYMEFTLDGVNWSKIGRFGYGTNWYDSTFDVWNTEFSTRWKVASTLLPKPAGGYYLRFRFVMAADPGTNFDGLAVDDIHIFDKTTTVFSPSTATATSATYLGSAWTNFNTGGTTTAAMGPGVHSFGNVEVLVYPHDTLYNTSATQATLPHSYNATPAGSLGDTATWQLFLTDAEFLKMLNDTACPYCTRAADAYRLGITHYANTNNPALQNGLLSDDTGGLFQFTPYPSVVWVPFDDGYYGQFAGGADGEFWFNDGGPTGNIPLGVGYLDFDAFKNNAQIDLTWYSLIDTAVAHYFVEKSTDGTNFSILLDTVAAGIAPSNNYVTTDDAGFGTNTKLYYRLNFTLKNGTSGTSPIRTVNNTDSVAMLANLDAERINHTTAALKWSSSIDAQFQNYTVERLIAGSYYHPIGGTIEAEHQTNYVYHLNDQPDPAGALVDGTVITFRVTGILANGGSVVFPEKSVVWSQNNALVNIYPNPVQNGHLTLLYECDPGTAVDVRITDAVGKQIYGTQLTASQWHNTTTLYTFAHPAGVYVVKVTIGGKTYIRKMEWL